MTNFTKEIKFEAAYDKRDVDPKKNYGIHGVDLTFILKNEQGAVVFKLFTGWHLPHVQKELENKDRILSKPMPADLIKYSKVVQHLIQNHHNNKLR